MTQRKRSDPNRPSWVHQLMAMKETIAKMPEGADRALAHQRAMQLEAAIGLDGWLRPTNRMRVLAGQPTQGADGADTRLFVVGDKCVGWSIRAISEGGRNETLVGIYTTRNDAENDLENAALTMRKHG